MHTRHVWIAPFLFTLATTGCTSFEKIGELESETDEGIEDGTETSGNQSDGDSQTASMSATTGDSATDSASSATVASDSDTASPTSTTVDGGTDTDDSSDTGGNACVGEGGQGGAYFFISSDAPFGDFLTAQDCTIAEMVTQQPEAGLVLECEPSGEAPTSYTIQAFPSEYFFLNVSVGQEVSFRFAQYAPFWQEQWFELRDPGNGELVLAGGAGSTVLPSVGGDTSGFFAPFTPSAVDGGCGLDEGECYTREPMILDMGLYDLQLLPNDETFTMPGNRAYQIRVDEVAIYHDIMCTDTPSGWFQWIIADTTEV